MAACGTTAATGAPTTPAGSTVASPAASAAATDTSTAVPATDRPAGAVTLAAREFDVPGGSHPHDVAPAVDGGVWYTGQRTGVLGHLDPATGTVREIPLGDGSAPHGVITGPDGAPWITDGGLNAIVRVDPGTDEVRVFPLPADRPGANLNTAAFDGDGVLWFTGQSGIYGRLDPATGEIAVFDDPEGRGPYGITATPGGDVWYASLAGSHIARIDPATRAAAIEEPPDVGPGRPARLVGFEREDLGQRVGCRPGRRPRSGVGHMAGMATARRPPAGVCRLRRRTRHRVADRLRRQRHRPLRPGDRDVRRDRAAQPGASVRQLLGRPGEVWGAESATDKLVVITEG